MMMRCVIAIMSWSQNDSLWRGKMWIPHWRQSSRHSPLWMKLWDRKGVILLDSLDPRQIINSDCYSWCIMLLTKLKARTSRQGEKKTYPKITSGPIPVWRLWSTLLVLAGLSYKTHHIVQISFWLPSVWADERQTVGNIFLATRLSQQLWNCWVGHLC